MGKSEGVGAEASPDDECECHEGAKMLNMGILGDVDDDLVKLKVRIRGSHGSGEAEEVHIYEWWKMRKRR